LPCSSQALVAGHQFCKALGDFRVGHSAEDSFDRCFGFERFGANQIEQELDGRILAGENDSGKEHGAKPRVGFFGKAFPQPFEALGRMRAGDGQCCLSCRIVGRGEETADPGNRSRAFDAKDAAVARAEHFRFFGV